MGVFDDMKASILENTPSVRTLGWLWRFKALGARRTEHTVTWERPNARVPQFPDTFSQTYVTVLIGGKEYLERFGKL